MARFSELINPFKKQWDETSKQLLAEIRRQITHPSVMTRKDAIDIIKKLSSHYYSFVENMYTTFEKHNLSTSQQEKLKHFVASLYTGVYEDVKRLTELYKEKEQERNAQFRHHLFQAQPDELPLPTFDEQHRAGKIFPDDQEHYPQYYICKFN